MPDAPRPISDLSASAILGPGIRYAIYSRGYPGDRDPWAVRDVLVLCDDNQIRRGQVLCSALSGHASEYAVVEIDGRLERGVLEWWDEVEQGIPLGSGAQAVFTA